MELRIGDTVYYLSNDSGEWTVEGPSVVVRIERSHPPMAVLREIGFAPFDDDIDTFNSSSAFPKTSAESAYLPDIFDNIGDAIGESIARNMAKLGGENDTLLT